MRKLAPIMMALLALYGTGANVCFAADSPLQKTFTHVAMGTEFAFTLYRRPQDGNCDELARVADEAFAAVDDADARLSIWRNDSEAARINAHAAEGPVRVSGDTVKLILYCQSASVATHGAFDITVGPLMRLWKLTPAFSGHVQNLVLPSGDEIAAARELVGSGKVWVDERACTVSFAREGVQLDFGGVGKGLALDLAMNIIKRNGVTIAALSAGTSSILTVGAPPGEQGWKVQIRDPFDSRRTIGEVILRNEGLSTSGCYEKLIEADGKKYCHIIDPRSGCPVEGMASVTVVAASGMESDAMSTAFFVMGPEGAREFCEGHHGLRAYLAREIADGKLQVVRVGEWP